MTPLNQFASEFHQDFGLIWGHSQDFIGEILAFYKESERMQLRLELIDLINLDDPQIRRAFRTAGAESDVWSGKELRTFLQYVADRIVDPDMPKAQFMFAPSGARDEDA